MAQILANGLVQFDDGRILYSDTPITGQDFMELQALLPKINPILGRSAMVGFPFVSGGGGGGGGSPGARGADGANGATGVQGATGPSGGPPGATGVQGQTGIQGATGAGVPGATGAGTQGQTGVQGGTGPGGTQGQTGVQGATGPAAGGGSALWQNIQENTIVTTNATPTVMLAETIPVGTVGTFRVVVDARYNDGSQHASFVKTIRVHNEGAGAILGVSNSDYSDDSSAALTADFIAAAGDIQVQVIGVAATLITWKARMGRVNLP